MENKNTKTDDKADLRQRAVELLRHQPQTLSELQKIEIAELVHELGVHQIELEMQNEELRKAQIELEASRHRYADLYDFAPVGYFTIDKNGAIVESNLTGCRMLGVDRAALINKQFHTFVSKESQDKFYLHRRTVVKTNAGQTCEITLVRKDKTTLAVLLESISAADTNGTRSLCRSIITDVTELKQAEKTAKQSTERYGSLTVATTQIVWTTDADGEVVEDLPTWRAFTGQSMEEARGWGWIGALHPDDRRRTTKIWLQAVKTRGIYQTGYRVKRHDGEYRDMSVHAVPVLEQDGSIREWVGTCLDITEHKAAQEKQAITNSLLEPFLRQSSWKEYLDLTVGVLQDWSGCEFAGIRIKDSRGNMPYQAYINFDKEFLALENNLNMDYDNCVCIRAIQGRPLEQDRNYMSPGGSFYCNDAQAFMGSLTKQQKTGYRGNCLKWGFQSIAVIPIRYGDEALGAIHLTDFKTNRVLLSKIQFIETVIASLIGEALTRYNAHLELEKYGLHLEEMVKQRTDELTRSNQDLEQFAYVTSHGLREPLRAISGFMELLSKTHKDSLDEKAREYIRYATESAERMDNLLTGLLRYSRIQTDPGVFTAIPTPGSLRTALANLQRTIEETGACITSDELPVVTADGIQMIELFQNLIANAIKFRGDQKPQIHVGCEKQQDCWRFSVRDNGIGIDPRSRDRIFVIFQRLHARDKYPGYGIGLSICKRIVDRHNGKIWVESQPGCGATFYFTIPDNRPAGIP